MRAAFKNDIIIVSAVAVGCKFVTENFLIILARQEIVGDPLAGNNLYKLQSQVLQPEYT